MFEFEGVTPTREVESMVERLQRPAITNKNITLGAAKTEYCCPRCNSWQTIKNKWTKCCFTVVPAHEQTCSQCGANWHIQFEENADFFQQSRTRQRLFKQFNRQYQSEYLAAIRAELASEPAEFAGQPKPTQQDWLFPRYVWRSLQSLLSLSADLSARPVVKKEWRRKRTEATQRRLALLSLPVFCTAACRLWFHPGTLQLFARFPLARTPIHRYLGVLVYLTGCAGLALSVRWQSRKRNRPSLGCIERHLYKRASLERLVCRYFLNVHNLTVAKVLMEALWDVQRDVTGEV